MKSSVRIVAISVILFGSGRAALAQPSLIVLNKEDAALVIVDPATRKVVGRVPTGESPHEVAVSPDGKLAFVANYGAQTPGQTISIIDLAARKEQRRLDLGSLRRPHGIFFVQRAWRSRPSPPCSRRPRVDAGHSLPMKIAEEYIVALEALGYTEEEIADNEQWMEEEEQEAQARLLEQQEAQAKLAQEFAPKPAPGQNGANGAARPAITTRSGNPANRPSPRKRNGCRSASVQYASRYR